MKWAQIHRVAISLPFAILAALLMVGINEVGYTNSNKVLAEMQHTYETRSSLHELMQHMLDAETGLRGYLLSDNEQYLQPYTTASTAINTELENLQKLYAPRPESREELNKLSRVIALKVAEMELSLKLFREGNKEAWQFVMFTDVGKQNMDDIRQMVDNLIGQSVEQARSSMQAIQESLFLLRMGIATVTAVALLAFYMYLRQSSVVEQVHKREQAIQTEERGRLEDLVRERTASLTELANHLQQVREDERGHLARELHDELGALLTAAKLDVARLKSRIDMGNPEVSERVQHLAETLNSGIALKRRIIEDLRPSSLSNLGLTTSLEILTSEFAQRSNLDIERSLEQVDLPDTIQLTIYRLIQESLTNIGKYANAQKVVVSVHDYPTYVAVQIQDDGEGFDMASIRPNSHGLAGMRHRVEAAGGRLTINSTIGQGTTISAVIPTNNLHTEPSASA